MPERMTVSVRQLVEFLLRGGDIDSGAWPAAGPHGAGQRAAPGGCSRRVESITAPRYS